MKPASGGVVQSLGRGLQILSWLAESEEGMALAEIADRLGVSRPTAFNLAGTLVAHGYATKTPRPVRYRLGASIARLSDRQRCWEWRGRMERELAYLAGTLPDCFLFLAENAGGDLRVALRLDPQLPGIIERTSTRPITPYVTALSLGYLAFCGSEDRREYERVYPFAEHGLGRWRDREDLERALGEARAAGALHLTDGPLCRVVVPLRRPGEPFAGLLCASFHAKSPRVPATVPPRLVETLLASAKRVGDAESDCPPTGGRA